MRQHASNNLTICGRQSLKQQIDLMLLRNKVLCCVLIPDTFTYPADPYLTLAVLAHPYQFVNHLPIISRFLWGAHFKCAIEA